jgi:hypothetical protein
MASSEPSRKRGREEVPPPAEAEEVPPPPPAEPEEVPVGENGLQKLCPRPARMTVSAHAQLRLHGGVLAVLV